LRSLLLAFVGWSAMKTLWGTRMVEDVVAWLPHSPMWNEPNFANGNSTLCTSVIVPGSDYHVQSLFQVVQIHTTWE
jgi:hypothetical protein